MNRGDWVPLGERFERLEGGVLGHSLCGIAFRSSLWLLVMTNILMLGMLWHDMRTEMPLGAFRAERQEWEAMLLRDAESRKAAQVALDKWVEDMSTATRPKSGR